MLRASYVFLNFKFGGESFRFCVPCVNFDFFEYFFYFIFFMFALKLASVNVFVLRIKCIEVSIFIYWSAFSLCE